MSTTPPADSVPPVEPTPVVAAPAVPEPPRVDPYAASTPPPPPGYPAYPAQPGQPGQPGYAAYPGQPGQPYAGYYAPGYYTPQPPRGLAIASMVCGIVGVFFALIEGFGILPSIAAVITGHIAQKRQPQARSMWMTGLICGYIGIGVSLIWIVVFVFIIVAAISAGAAAGSYNLGS